MRLELIEDVRCRIAASCREAGEPVLQFTDEQIVNALDQERAQDADLVTFGEGVSGAVCANCEYVGRKDGEDYCENEHVDQLLPDGRDSMCCSFWDRPGTKRSWQRRSVQEAFDPSEPRDEEGKWTSGSGGGAEGKKPQAIRGEMTAARREGKAKEARIILGNGKSAPPHIKPSMVPPDWTDVKIATDPSADVLVTARDNKGRLKTVYSDNFAMRTAALKFSRVLEGLEKAEMMHQQNQANRLDPKTREEADCLWLIQEQGTRPGSNRDTKGKVKAYGATTLLGQHVEIDEDGETRLHFIGKEGVEHNHVIRNSELAAMLRERAQKAGPDGKLFATDDTKLREYTRTLDGGSFTPKDFRTMLATGMAVRYIKDTTPPKSVKEYKQAVKAVAEKVSQVLGNRPQQALESYISPAVFSVWSGHV